MKNKFRSGFTLVELLVVVSILGIILSIAIPNLRKFQNKSRQAEAKNLLALMYSMNQTFLNEYNSYHNCFECLDFSPKGKLRYKMGWEQAALIADINSYTNPATVSRNTDEYTAVHPEAQKNYPATLTLMNDNIVSASPGIYSSYVVCAMAQLVFVDEWCMNEKKVLSSISDGT